MCIQIKRVGSIDPERNLFYRNWEKESRNGKKIKSGKTTQLERT